MDHRCDHVLFVDVERYCFEVLVDCEDNFTVCVRPVLLEDRIRVQKFLNGFWRDDRAEFVQTDNRRSILFCHIDEVTLIGVEMLDIVLQEGETLRRHYWRFVLFCPILD